MRLVTGTETCSCGAVVAVEAATSLTIAARLAEFREAHAVCRENAAGSTPSTASAGTTSGQGAGEDESDRAHSHPAPEPEQCRAVTVGLLGSTLRCRRIAGHPGDHIDATGTKWYVGRPPTDTRGAE